MTLTLDENTARYTTHVHSHKHTTWYLNPYDLVKINRWFLSTTNI